MQRQCKQEHILRLLYLGRQTEANKAPRRHLAFAKPAVAWQGSGAAVKCCQLAVRSSGARSFELLASPKVCTALERAVGKVLDRVFA